jgi:hypothetical protein
VIINYPSRSILVFLEVHDRLRRDNHSPLRQTICLVGRHHESVAIILLLCFLCVFFWLTGKRILSTVITLLLCLLAISLEHSNVLGLNGRQLREVEALSRHFWLVEGHAPERNYWSKNLLQIIRPKYIILIWECVLVSANCAAEGEPPLDMTVTSQRLQRGHIIINLKENVRGESEQCEANWHIEDVRHPVAGRTKG